jgi:hypothetical protein
MYGTTEVGLKLECGGILYITYNRGQTVETVI